MLRCADELDDLQPSMTESPSRHTSYPHLPHGYYGSGATSSQVEQLRETAMRKAAKRMTTFKCLQVDLREFQLGTYSSRLPSWSDPEVNFSFFYQTNTVWCTDYLKRCIPATFTIFFPLPSKLQMCS